MDHYRRAANEESPECMGVYPDETPWTVPGDLSVVSPRPTVLPRIVCTGNSYRVVRLSDPRLSEYGPGDGVEICRSGHQTHIPVYLDLNLDMFSESHSFVAKPVTRSNYFVSFQ